jgi:hypothetical protein
MYYHSTMHHILILANTLMHTKNTLLEVLRSTTTTTTTTSTTSNSNTNNSYSRIIPRS